MPSFAQLSFAQLTQFIEIIWQNTETHQLIVASATRESNVLKPPTHTHWTRRVWKEAVKEAGGNWAPVLGGPKRGRALPRRVRPRWARVEGLNTPPLGSDSDPAQPVLR